MILETQKLILKPIVESDLNTLHGMFTNFYVRRYLCDGEILSLQQVEEMLAENKKLFEESKLGLWFIETKNDREIIGFVGLWYLLEEAQSQLLYALLPKALKKGYATEASTKRLEYGLNELGLDYIVASCDRPNIESLKVAERLGMKEVESRIVDGNPILFFRIDNLSC
ncbi:MULTISPECIES: GNAT family N-acetyltransferase [unclassified Microcoleus]|uniref:GNAT family N-acetyltransferase n=1 Tax=unclassified Microcoleus TaxID=2642155 RepID=UPI002FCF58ED